MPPDVSKFINPKAIKRLRGRKARLRRAANNLQLRRSHPSLMDHMSQIRRLLLATRAQPQLQKQREESQQQILPARPIIATAPVVSHEQPLEQDHWPLTKEKYGHIVKWVRDTAAAAVPETPTADVAQQPIAVAKATPVVAEQLVAVAMQQAAVAKQQAAVAKQQAAVAKQQAVVAKQLAVAKLPTAAVKPGAPNRARRHTGCLGNMCKLAHCSLSSIFKNPWM